MRITILALANAARISAEAEEVREVERVLNKPLDHFTQRNKAKNDAAVTQRPDSCLPLDFGLATSNLNVPSTASAMPMA
jgi:hypothetical protein